MGRDRLGERKQGRHCINRVAPKGESRERASMVRSWSGLKVEWKTVVMNYWRTKERGKLISFRYSTDRHMFDKHDVW